MSNLRTWIILGSQLTLVLTGPIYTPQLLTSGSGGIIRNLPCISMRTKETGVCMFAMSCERANGTHLTTCVDRYYFGSCCKLPDYPEAHPQHNTIEVGYTSSPLDITSALEETIIRDDYSSSKPIVNDEAVLSTTSVSYDGAQKAVFFISYATIQLLLEVLGDYTDSNYFQARPNTFTTKSVLQQSSSISTIPQKLSITESTPIVTTAEGLSGPTSNVDATFTKPVVTEITTKMPVSNHDPEPSQWPMVNDPMMSSIPRPTSSMTESTSQSTSFLPRNATTTGSISVTTTSVKPTTSTVSSNNTLSEMTTVMETTAWPQGLSTAKPSSLSTTSNTAVSENEASNLSIMSLVFNGTILTNEIPRTTKVPTTAVDTEENILSTQSPGLITWSSYFDYKVTTVPEVSTASPEVDNSANNSASTEGSSSLGASVPTIPLTTIPDGNVESLLIPTDNFNMSDYKQVCGMRLVPDSRIVGGDATTFGKWPWQISLQRWNTSSSAFEHSCGAVLLTNNWAVTAAHCVEAIPWKYLMLIIGEHDRNKKDEAYEYQERSVHFVFSHPQFDVATFEYDLALLRFDKPLKSFQPNIMPICLPDDDEYYVGHIGFVTGWGRLSYDGRGPSVLYEVSVPVISNTACERMYKRAGYKEHIPNIFICAGRSKGGIDSCEGDSGGPMVIQRPSDNRWILVGVISWGIGCGAPNQPGVYTRISEFREWIIQSVQLVDEAYIEAESFV